MRMRRSMPPVNRISALGSRRLDPAVAGTSSPRRRRCSRGRRRRRAPDWHALAGERLQRETFEAGVTAGWDAPEAGLEDAGQRRRGRRGASSRARVAAARASADVAALRRVAESPGAVTPRHAVPGDTAGDEPRLPAGRVRRASDDGAPAPLGQAAARDRCLRHAGHAVDVLPVIRRCRAGTLHVPFRARCSDGRRVGTGGLSAGGRKHQREHADRERRQPSHRPTAERAAARSISLASDFITKPARTARRAARLNAEV